MFLIFMLRREISFLMEKKGFSGFTEIQKAAIPFVLSGEDCLIIAPVGFGKTEAAVFPILSKLLDFKDKGVFNGIQAIYVTPLRALNRDLLSRLTFWCNSLGISLDVRHGDTSATQRAKQRDSPPQFLITTPETFNALLVAPKLRDSLANVKWVVLDEVHELCETKRGLQLSIALERLRERAPFFQVIGLSATVGNEQDVASFISSKARVVKLDFLRELDVFVESPFPKKETSRSFISLSGVSPETEARLERIKELVLSHKKTLFFVNTRAMAEGLASLIFQVPELKDVFAVHHSSLSKEVRIETENRFKEGDLRAIICTSSLELGMDVGDVDLVIQYVSPRQVTRFIQRVGRSGHKRQLVPKGVLICGSGLDCFESLVLARRAKRHEIESLEIRKNALDVLAHQIAGLALDFGVIDLKKAYSIVIRAFPFKSLSLEDFSEVVEQLHKQHLIYLRYNAISKSPATLLYYYENLSTIPDEKMFFVKDSETRRNMGVLHEGFVSDNLSVGSVFITRGRPWRVLSIVEGEILVESSESFEAAVPDWEGEELPVVNEVAQEVASLFERIEGLSDESIKRDFFCSQEVVEKVREFVSLQKAFFLPSPSSAVVEVCDNLLLFHTFLGTRENEALARLVSHLLSAELGVPIRVRSSTYSIIFEFSKPYSPERFVSLLKELASFNVESILNSVVPFTSMFRYRFLHVARRFGFLSRKAELRELSLKRLVESQFKTPIYREALQELYFDKLRVEKVRLFLEDVRKKKISLYVVKGVSPIAQHLLDFEGYSELFAPMEPTYKILDIFKKGLEGKRVNLICTYCRKPFSRGLSDSLSFSCPYCSSTQITLGEYADVLKKEARVGLNGLSFEEKKKYRELLLVTRLISTYGRKALIALETHGVGPKTAARLLSNSFLSEEDFYRALLEQQKTFLRTKKYWRA